ncbi:MAG: hypothetical protein IKB05_03130 [Alphaproteobacteria bacterium]|nr:hypothetical protein [Alphaproteobacteria bacterium]
MNKKLVLLLFFIGPLLVHADVVSPSTTCPIGMQIRMPDVRFGSVCAEGDVWLSRRGRGSFNTVGLFDGCLDASQMSTLYSCIMYAPSGETYSDETGDYNYNSACLMD